MKLVTYQMRRGEPEHVGVVHGGEVCPVAALGLPYREMESLIVGLTQEERSLLEKAQGNPDSIPLDRVQLCAPIPRPSQDVVCLGNNYVAHAEEFARYKKEEAEGKRNHAVYFSKRVHEAVAHGGFIEAHRDLTERLDYESELAVIIGKPARNVAEADAFSYVFGYTILNDMSAREVQTQHDQWYFGKSLDGFTPMGPWIVTADEFDAPPLLQVKSRVNGEPRQDGNTSLMLFGIAHVIAELSKGMTLRPGTIISTGTPAGVGAGFDPPRFLKPGDVVECEIDGIGVLRNTVVE